MNQTPFHKELEQELWSDSGQERSFPEKRPLLAHYTSIATFERIVTTNQFWLSNPLYMNDLEELRFGLNEGHEEFTRSKALIKACRSEDNHSLLIGAFKKLFYHFDAEHVLNTYVMCFSEHNTEDNDGLLSMWRGYGGGGAGVALVIDTSKIKPIPSSPLLIGKVRYGSRADRLTWINSSLERLSGFIEKHAKSHADYTTAAEAWLNRLKTFALFSKHNGFHEEREWRVVYMSDRDPTKRLQSYYSHIATNKGIEPKLKLPVQPIDGFISDNLSLDLLVNRIILGPTISSTLAKNAAKQMLRNIKQSGLAERVIASEIPFRPTFH